MKIDSHLHLNFKKYKELKAAFSGLSNDLNNANIDKAVVIHMDNEPWSIDEFGTELKNHENLIGIININPLSENAIENANKAIISFNYKGIKLHPRIHNYDLDDIQVFKFIKNISKLNIPIIIDAFPDGTYLMNGFSTLKYAKLAQSFPNVNFVWAHMGGYKLIEFMLIAKRLKNVYFDFSYSFLYFRESTIIKDFIYCFKSMRFNKIFYGSDYPDREILDSFDMSIKILKEFNLTDEEINKLIFENSNNFWFHGR